MIPIFGDHEPDTLNQISRCRATADYAVLCADGHKGYAVPIGGVVAYKNAISPSGVGYDIGCGNKAVRLDVPAQYVRENIKSIMDLVFKTISFGVGRHNDEKVEWAPLDSDTNFNLDFLRPLKDKAAAQLGTVGSGNHYVDVFIDDNDQVWVGVHFGSRGFGHGIATYFLKAAGAKDGMDVEPCVLDANSDLGMQYIYGMNLAGQYAYAGRDWVCSKVASIIGGGIVEEIHNHHNFAWREQHFGEFYWVVRKGSTPAFPGQRGFVGGTMCEPAVILQGAESTVSQLALYSTVHGAGRVMGRMEAKGTFDRKTGECKRPGKITQEMFQESVQRAGIELRGAGLDESMFCYKRLYNVLAAHLDSITVTHKLTPIGVAMAGANEFDPYKD